MLTTPLNLEQHEERHSLNLGGLQLDTRLTVIVVVSTLLLILEYYHNWFPDSATFGWLSLNEIERLVYFLLIPLLIIRYGFRDAIADYGFRVGDWRLGLKYTLILCAAASPLLYLVTQLPSMQGYYQQPSPDPWAILINNAVYYLGWEFLFRGFMLFGLLEVIGPSAVLLQAVPFTLMHLGKPEIEILSCIFGGTLFGWVAWRTRSFFYPFLIHLFVSTLVILVAQG